MPKPAKAPKVKYYWDSNLFLSLIEGTPERLPVLETLLSQVDAEEIEVFTSHLTITEVAFAKAERDGGALDPDIESKIDEFWSVTSPFRQIEVHQGIAFDAKALMRDALLRGWSLKPADAIHLVSARSLKVKELFTYDDKLWRFKDVIGIEVCAPHCIQLPLFTSAGPTHPIAGPPANMAVAITPSLNFGLSPKKPDIQ